MRTFKAYFRKEIIESWRQYRYLILVVGFIFFAILGPVMIKLLPVILKGKIPEELIRLINFTPLEAARSYMKDVFQIVNLFVVLSLMGIFSDEINNQKLVFPYSKGARIEGIVLAKFSHYAITIFICSLLGFALNTYYVNSLFKGDRVSYAQMMGSASLFALYYIFTIALLFFLSSLTRRGIAAGITVLLFNYLSPLVLQLFRLQGWVPHTLVIQANRLGMVDSGLLKQILVSVIFYILILQWLTIRKMKKVEVV
ncbi:hypothetical protein BBF96_01065 [Anoxybacter fermentans]|uniref:ABC transporter permease n=1 Tax=Anoxybacter fermentans TaxID=1323375 RepID=A0A3S9SV08_9FIRM|nr:ABC transporter permease [Anoxybacter fermentans]AZR72104.1 hypothetical protein BBF96_01065 [Anoxybacter fermentans]